MGEPGPALDVVGDVVAGLDVAAAVVAADGRALRPSRGLSRLTGLAAEHLTGRPLAASGQPGCYRAAAGAVAVATRVLPVVGSSSYDVEVAVEDPAELDRAAAHVTAVLDLAERLSVTTGGDLDALGLAAAQAVRDVVPGDVALFLVDAHGNAQQPVVVACDDPAAADQVHRIAALAPQLTDHGYVGQVCRSGQALVVDRPWSDGRAAALPPSVQAAPRMTPLRALLVVPLAVAGRVVGVLLCARHDDREGGYTAHEQAHVAAVTAVVATPLALARLAAVHAGAARQERALAEVERRCQAARGEPDSVLAAAARAVAEQAGGLCAVWLLDEAGAEHLGRGALSLPQHPDREAGLTERLLSAPLVPGPFVREALEHGRAYVAGREETARVLAAVPPLQSRAHPGAGLGPPVELYGVQLSARGRPVGVLVTARFDAPTTIDERGLVDVLAERVATAIDTALLLAETEATQQRHRALVRHCSDSLLLAGADGQVRYASPAATRLFGRRLGESVLASVVPGEREAAEQVWRDVLARPGVSPPVELRVAAASGDVRRLSAVANNLLHDPAVDGVVLTVRDVTEERAASERLAERASQQAALAAISATALTAEVSDLYCLTAVRVAETLELERIGVMALLPSGGWRLLASTNPAVPPGVELPTLPESGLARLLATGEAVVVEDYRLTDVVDERTAVDVYGVLSGALAPIVVGGQVWGAVTAHSVQHRRFSAVEADFLRTVATVLASAVERSAYAERVLEQAAFDALTGLPNRATLQAQLHDELRAGRPMALLLLDLDEFKDVNDSLGHGAGDLVLAQLGERLRDVVAPDRTVARLGGDEFAVALPEVSSTDEAVATAQRLLRALEQAFALPGIDVTLSASIGIALAPGHGRDADQLLQAADMAMYRAKEERTGWAVFDSARDRQRAERLSLLAELRAALSRGELVLHYQPLVDLGDQRVREVEALVRWQHPTRGLLLPDAFVPLADQTELVHDFTAHVVRLAARQALAWRAAGWTGSVSVNISAVALRSPAEVDQLHRALAEGGDALTVEITESAFVDERARGAVEQLATAGIRCSVDDFGTGYSALAYLRTLPVTRLKLDRAFIARVDRVERDALIVGGVVDLAHSIGLDVVAEGVETASVAARLRQLGVDVAQGWLYGRPLPADQLDLR